MPDSPSIDFTGGVDTSVAAHAQDEAFDMPASGMAYAQGSLHPPTIASAFDATINAKVMGWIGSPQDASTILGGSFDRWRVYATRFNVMAPNFGITKLNAELRWNDPGLKLHAGISPQEDYVYPYNFNGAAMAIGDYEWTAPTLRYNLFDNTSGANIYTGTIGWLFGVEWAPDYLAGLRVVAQTGPDGGFVGSKSWAKTAQVGYTGEYSAGGIDGATSVAVYATSLNPAEETNEFGETVSPKNGIGGFFSQTIGPVGFGIGYAFNRRTTTGDGMAIDSRTHGVNAGYNVRFDGKVPVVLSGGYSYLGFREDIDAFLSSQERTGEHSIEPVNVTVGLLPGLALTAGGNFVIVDQKNQTNTEINGNEQVFYGVLTYNGNATIE
ncbi:MAG: hypothetical protein HY541_00405 [Deltaproteobacteria bacterium]|nr:hypothetical protein [Deltaproteobacteria bacterium]